MPNYFKIFRATAKAPMLGPQAANFSKLNWQATQTRIFKRGAYGTIGTAAGAGIGAHMSNDYSHEAKSDVKKGIVAGAALGAAVTLGVLTRKPIGRVIRAAGAGISEGTKVFFRRIRGRVIPVRVKV